MNGLVVLENGSVVIRDMPIPEISEYQVLVKLESGGLCGTDMKILHNSLKGYSKYPTVLGHEGVGSVVKLGTKVRNFEVGDRLVLPYIFGDIGDYHSTWGAFADYAVAGDTDALLADGYKLDNKILYEFNYAQRKIPREINPVAACMIVTFREVYAAIKRLGFKKDQGIVIFGAGAVGLTFIQLVKMLGMGPVVSVEIHPEKLKEAAKRGADYTFNSNECEIETEIKKIFPDGAPVVLDAAGVPQIINTALNVIAPYGDICIYGVTPKNEHLINWDKAPYNWNLKFLQWPLKMEEAAVHDQIIQWILEGKLNGLDYISDVFDFKDSIQAMELFESRKNLKKIALTWN